MARSFVRNVMLWLEVYTHANKVELKKSIERPLVGYINQHTSLMNEEGYKEVASVLEDAGYKLSLDEYADMIEFVTKKTDNDTYQAMEGLVHNLNSLASRAGGQVPFSSVNFGTDTTTEGRMIIKNILLATEAGLGNGETAIFPISIFRMRKGITDKGSPNYDLFKLACRVSSKRLYPNFINTSSSFNDPYVDPNDPRTLVATINMPVALQSNLYRITHLNGQSPSGISHRAKWHLA